MATTIAPVKWRMNILKWFLASMVTELKMGTSGLISTYDTWKTRAKPNKREQLVTSLMFFNQVAIAYLCVDT